MIRISWNGRVGLGDVVAVAYGREGVTVDPHTLELLGERRRQIVGFVRETSKPAYGFNRGFGHNVDEPVPPDRLEQLQVNLIRSHAAGVGDPAPVEVVRAAMFLRAVSLARGNSGVRPEVVQALVELLEHHITPVVPEMGSVGASGDLAPMSHIALALIGEGKVMVPGHDEPVPASQAMEAAGLAPLTLEMKEGLALTNGVQFSTALGILTWDRLRDLYETAAATTALSTQVMLGSATPFREDLHRLRPHPGALDAARLVRRLMEGSPLTQAHQPYDIDGEIQDPYNIRCAAQILGACKELIDEAEATFEIEANSVTDNPVILEREPGSFTDIVSGGHFHGMPIAVRVYGLIQAMATMARLSNMRCARYVDQARNKGLGSDLKWPGLSDEERATSSAMMIPEYASAALTNAIWGAAMPSHLFSLSTDAGQEDHTSMSAPLAVRAWHTLPRLAEVLAIELAYASQAAAIRRRMDHLPSKHTLGKEQAAKVEPQRQAYEHAVRDAVRGEPFGVEFDLRLKYELAPEARRLSPVSEQIVALVSGILPTVTQDRSLSEELQTLARTVLDGEVARIVRSAVGE